MHISVFMSSACFIDLPWFCFILNPLNNMDKNNAAAKLIMQESSEKFHALEVKFVNHKPLSMGVNF